MPAIAGGGGPQAPGGPGGSPTLSFPLAFPSGTQVTVMSVYLVPPQRSRCCHCLFGWFRFFLQPMTRLGTVDLSVKIADSLTFCIAASVDATKVHRKANPPTCRLEPQGVTFKHERPLSLPSDREPGTVSQPLWLGRDWLPVEYFPQMVSGLPADVLRAIISVRPLSNEFRSQQRFERSRQSDLGAGLSLLSGILPLHFGVSGFPRTSPLPSKPQAPTPCARAAALIQEELGGVLWEKTAMYRFVFCSSLLLAKNSLWFLLF